MTAPRPRSRWHRICQVWSLALRGNRLLRAERIAHRQTRQLLVNAKSLAEHRAAQIVDLEARCRRLDETLDLLSMGRTRAMERGDG